jgi:hypothetical protein
MPAEKNGALLLAKYTGERFLDPATPPQVDARSRPAFAAESSTGNRPKKQASVTEPPSSAAIKLGPALLRQESKPLTEISSAGEASLKFQHEASVQARRLGEQLAGASSNWCSS